MAKKIEKGFLAKLKRMLIDLEAVRTTDGKNLMVDGNIEVGKDIMIDNDGEYEPAPSGEYDTGDVTLVVEAGRITEIRENKPVEEAEPEPEDMSKAKFAAVKQAYEQTYEERIRKIAAAIIALGYTEYGYIAEASDESAVWSYWDEVTNEEHFVHFTLTWTEGDVVASDPIEVVPTFKPKEGDGGGAAATIDETEALKGELESLKSENASLKEQLGKAAVPPAEAEEKEGNTKKALVSKFIDAARSRQ